MTENIKNLRKEILKQRREIRKKVLGGTESAHQRNYTEATKTRLAIKTEIFGAKSKSSKYGEETSLEKFVDEFLVENKLEIIKQKRIRYTNYDFYVKEANLLIEVQGCYWHVCPVCYPKGPKNEIQRKNLEKNEIKRKFAQEANIPLLEVWAHEIEKQPEEIKKKILEIINVSICKK